VHTVLGFSSILLVIVGSILLLGMLRFLSDWTHRRLVQLFVLTMPLVTLGIGISGLHHFTGHSCFSALPFWDLFFGVVVPLGMVIIALGALSLGAVRLILMARVMARYRTPIPLSVQTRVETLVKRLHTASPRVQICTCDRPLAFTCGIFRPTILLSTWMLSHLDPQELEAVLMHELEHVARHDYLIIFLATILRDAFFYLPTSWQAYRQLQREKEFVCDDLAVHVTQRPLALASALAKVWLHAAETPYLTQFGGAQLLVEKENTLNTRIDRLISPQTKTYPARFIPIGVKAVSILILFIVQGVSLFLVLSLMNCNPLALLKMMF
jgi:beta-lactamase regulating signal transducer with metallopeptidase domain